MPSHVPSPTSSPASAVQDTSLLSQESSFFRSSQTSNPDSSCLSLESSFQLDTGYPSQNEESQKHPKGKRKRTTTQDKTILESAYNANPKPDKAARLDLVKRVTLNEKEVQIWFQNRRQNDRRKSRPLSPLEIAQLRYGGGLHMLSSENPSFRAAEGLDAAGTTRPADVSQHSSMPSYSASQEWPSASHGDSSAVADSSRQDRRHSEPGSARLPLPSSQKEDAASEAPALSQSLPGGVGYLSNRWHASDSFSAPSTVERSRHEPFRLESLVGTGTSETSGSPVHTLSQTLPKLSKSSSQFRISLSLEGKAEIVSSLQSPPRQAPQPAPLAAATLPPVRAPRILQRSKSALPTLPPISALTANLPPQLPRGRSRNVSAWESCCDADTRDQLTRLAENESSGSAVAAISLLRSSSQTSSLANLVHGHMPGGSNVLKPSSGKRNATPNGRHDLTHKRTKLGRSSSSVARLQSIANAAALDKPQRTVEEVEPANKYRKGSLAEILSPSGDSDKENWSPGKEGNLMGRRRPLPSIAAAAMSGATKAMNPRRAGPRGLDDLMSRGSPRRTPLGGRSNTAPAPRLRGGKGADRSLVIFEDSGSDTAFNEDDDENEGSATKKPRRSNDEVERFMRGEVSPSKRGDVDCVAGLLALSQGNWR